MSWQVGDLAVCVDREPFYCGKSCHRGIIVPPVGTVLVVVAVAPSSALYPSPPYDECDCLTLIFADDSCGIARRFRKVVSDKHEACEEEFVTLLNRTKRTVKA